MAHSRSVTARRLIALSVVATALVVPAGCGSVEQARNCAELVINVGRFSVQALGDEQDQAKAQTTLDEIAADAPPEVRTDLDFLGEQIAAIKDAPDNATREQITSSQEFGDAVRRLGEYVTTKCEQG